MSIDHKSPLLNLRLLACSFGLAVMTSQALVVEASVPDPEPTACALEASLSAPGGDQCLGITPDELLELSDLIDQAVVYAEADDAANGVTGAYTGAATYSRVMLENARDTVDARIDWLSVRRTDRRNPWPARTRRGLRSVSLASKPTTPPYPRNHSRVKPKPSPSLRLAHR